MADLRVMAESADSHDDLYLVDCISLQGIQVKYKEVSVAKRSLS